MGSIEIICADSALRTIGVMSSPSRENMTELRTTATTSISGSRGRLPKKARTRAATTTVMAREKATTAAMTPPKTASWGTPLTRSRLRTSDSLRAVNTLEGWPTPRMSPMEPMVATMAICPVPKPGTTSSSGRFVVMKAKNSGRARYIQAVLYRTNRVNSVRASRRACLVQLTVGLGRTPVASAAGAAVLAVMAVSPRRGLRGGGATRDGARQTRSAAPSATRRNTSSREALRTWRLRRTVPFSTAQDMSAATAWCARSSTSPRLTV